MGRPRKIITRVIAFLLLGTIVNIGVAWACTWRAAHDDLDFDPPGLSHTSDR
ncbi:MAG: hypothetical protein L0219_05520 [Phycisphaerales bacterium]|nr:hypothetical protein [Phycisphaerales bacterium]